MRNFALIGAAGYIAPRHMKAIKETGHQLVAAVDPNDSVGIIDSFFPEARFFTEFEKFDRHLEKLRRLSPERKVDYVSICSPNHLHDAHVRAALRVQAHAICEKPLVINPWNLDQLQALEEEFGKNVYCILQLRNHPSIVELREKVLTSNTRSQIKLNYITRRGNWYHISWKGDHSKSGGITMNIGVHFFDMLMWVFGKCNRSEVWTRDEDRAAGFLELENADVEWFLSTNEEDLPDEAKIKGSSAFRSILIDNQEMEFTTGFTDLHTQVYQKIIAGNGLGIEAIRPSIELVYQINNQEISNTRLKKVD